MTSEFRSREVEFRGPWHGFSKKKRERIYIVDIISFDIVCGFFGRM